MATPFLKRAGVAGYGGLGALYQAPDGTLYKQVQGLAEDAELRGLSEDQVTQMMGVGYLGEVRQGPDGAHYQYVQGVDGLGNPIGSWWRRLARRALPFVRRLAPFIPGGAAALTVATPFLKQAGVAGYGGLGALYQAPDGTVYQQVQGLDDDAELRGLDADDELHGLDDDPELRGFDEGEELHGFDEDTDLRGLEDDMELRGLKIAKTCADSTKTGTCRASPAMSDRMALAGWKGTSWSSLRRPVGMSRPPSSPRYGNAHGSQHHKSPRSTSQVHCRAL